MKDIKVILTLKGDLKAGFEVTLAIGEEGQSTSVEKTGRLPPNPEMEGLYDDWESSYYRYYSNLCHLRVVRVIKKPTRENIKADCDNLSERLNDWLLSDGFRRFGKNVSPLFPHGNG